jgi:hypothetical protein
MLISSVPYENLVTDNKIALYLIRKGYKQELLNTKLILRIIMRKNLSRVVSGIEKKFAVSS